MDRNSGLRVLALVCRDISRLARSTALDRETDPRRVLPVIPPEAGWRVLPRLYRRVADAGEASGALTATEAAFLHHCAADIEGTSGPTPVIGDVADKGVSSVGR